MQHAHIYIHSGSYKISIKRLSLFNIATRPTIDVSLGVGMVGGVKATFIALLALVLGVQPIQHCQWPMVREKGPG